MPLPPNNKLTYEELEDLLYRLASYSITNTVGWNDEDAMNNIPDSVGVWLWNPLGDPHLPELYTIKDWWQDNKQRFE